MLAQPLQSAQMRLCRWDFADKVSAELAGAYAAPKPCTYFFPRKKYAKSPATRSLWEKPLDCPFFIAGHAIRAPGGVSPCILWMLSCQRACLFRAEKGRGVFPSVAIVAAVSGAVCWVIGMWAAAWGWAAWLRWLGWGCLLGLHWRSCCLPSAEGRRMLACLILVFL